MKTLDLSPLATSSTVKANSGHNTLISLYSGKGFWLSRDNMTIDMKINYKTGLSNPQSFYLNR